MPQPHLSVSPFSSSMPAQQLMPAASQSLQGGLAAVTDVSVQQLLLPPQRHYRSSTATADTAAAHTSVAVSLLPGGGDCVVLELTAVRNNPPPDMVAPCLPSDKNAANSPSTHGTSQDSASHAARDSAVHAPLQPASMPSQIDFTSEEPTAPVVDTQGPPLLDTQGPPLEYTQVHMPRSAWTLHVANHSSVMCKVTPHSLFVLSPAVSQDSCLMQPYSAAVPLMSMHHYFD